ncbi:PHP domain-containing protein [Sedimentibacter sp. MB31-C6]|uniref:PHP domain-containing protein n=1 Tax=Sedimentibacter sp. MB31-C6 TaxID=3109366 RepID=UPI002DDCE120|nr:PHP domain-containing protein [Sedimentibacter sp. MB36-C1]WSI05028.1 PHP domain-containing protein [Sedimentibacter sp. MB36-C1]
MIDLHIHSMFSDGTDSIDDIVEIVKEKNIPAISLTDHDTTYGVAEIINKTKPHNIKVIPGIEISSVSNGHLIHILGYNIDINNGQLQELLNRLANYFYVHFCEQYTWLQKNHIINFNLNKILKYAEFKQSIAPSDILKAMIANGAPYTLKDWPEFFNKKVRLYPSNFIKDFPINSSEAVEIIKLAGGIPVFAHPARIGNADLPEMELLLPHGLGGIEVYYPYHDKKLINRYENFALKHNLIKTGGTDWHGTELTTWKAEIGDYGVNDLEYRLNS